MGLQISYSVGYSQTDTTPPTVEITSTESSPTSSSVIPISITFSEGVTGFGEEDVSISNGSVGSLSSISEGEMFIGSGLQGDRNDQLDSSYRCSSR